MQPLADTASVYCLNCYHVKQTQVNYSSCLLQTTGSCTISDFIVIVISCSYQVNNLRRFLISIIRERVIFCHVNIYARTSISLFIDTCICFRLRHNGTGRRFLGVCEAFNVQLAWCRAFWYVESVYWTHVIPSLDFITLTHCPQRVGWCVAGGRFNART